MMTFRIMSAALSLSFLTAGCGRDLPGDAPLLSLEVASAKRADANFCFAEDDITVGAFTPLSIRDEIQNCVRLTVLRPDGSFAGGNAADSTCSIRPNPGASGLKLQDPLGFVLRTQSARAPDAPLSPDEPVVVRFDLFNNGQLLASGSTAPFLPGGGERLSLPIFQENRFSCLPPVPLLDEQGNPVLDEQGNPAQSFGTLRVGRAFHSATRVGDPNAGEAEGIVVAGGITRIDLNQGDGALTDSIEVLDRRTMRFAEVGALTTPRAFHEAVALPTSNGQLKVVLVGGTTKPQGLRFDAFPKQADGVTPLVAKSPFPLMPAFTDGATSYDDETAAGAEVITLNAEDLSFVDASPIDTAPGRFGAAAAVVGDSVLVFGGIATTPDQGCTDIGPLTNFVCNSSFALQADAAGNFETIELPALSTERVGAAALVVPGNGVQNVLVLGGHLTGAAADVFTVDADGNVTGPQPLNIEIDPLLAAGQLQRAFFGISPIPGTTNEFFWFGGEQLSSQATGRLALLEPQAPNFAARISLDFSAGTGEFTLNVIAIDPPEVTRPYTLQGVAAAKDPAPNIAIELPVGINPGDELTFAELDSLSEERALDPANEDVFTNLGERFVFPVALSDTDAADGRVLVFGGARHLLFPQDSAFAFDPATNEIDELPSPFGDQSLHLFRRAVGLRGVVLPGRGNAASIAVLTGGLTGLPVPALDDNDQPVFLLDEDGNAVDGVAFFSEFFDDDAQFTQLRRDVTFFLFRNPTVETVLEDACDPSFEDAFTESPVCGFANSSIRR